MAEAAEKGSFVKMQEEPGSVAGRGPEASYRGRNLMSTASANSGRPKKTGWGRVADACKRYAPKTLPVHVTCREPTCKLLNMSDN